MSQQNQISEKKIILPPWLKPNLGYERVSFSSTSSTFFKRIQSVPINQPVRLISGTSNTTPSSQNCREIIQKRVVMSVMEKRVTLPARLRHHDEIQETCFTPVVPTPCQMYQKSRAQLPLKQQQLQTTEKSYNNNKCNNHQPSPKTTTSCSTSTSKQQT